MSEKHVKDIVQAVKQDDLYEQTLTKLSEADRASVEATVVDFATLLGPLIDTLDQLERSDEIMAVVRARLSERARGG